MLPVWVVGFVLVPWIGWLVRFAIVARPRRPPEPGYEFIWIEDDGQARELSVRELETIGLAFRRSASRPPYVKAYYAWRNPQGGLAGYLRRRLLPPEISIRS
jgi:hypothetical protein